MVAKTFPKGLKQFAFILILAVGILIPLLHATVVHADTVVTNPTLPLTFSKPSWWTDQTHDCDATFYNANNTAGQTATLYYTWRGIQACGPRPHGRSSYDALDSNITGNGQYQWECTELAARYLQVAYGARSLMANGGVFASTYATSTYTKNLFQYYQNNSPATDTVFPQEGDVISLTSAAPQGHVAIVIGLSVSGTPGSATITMMDQNGDDAESPAGTFQLSIVNYVIQDFDGYHATDWIHPRVWSNISPSFTTHDTIYSMSASSTTNVWAAGNEKPSGSWTPVTFNYNGASWTKYSPPYLGSNNDYLYGIASSASGDTWTVGTYYSYPQWK